MDYHNDTHIGQRVMRGMEWLDEFAPAEWWNLVDLETLELSDQFNCVLGQVFADRAYGYAGMSGYSYVYTEYGDRPDTLSGPDITACGFSASGKFSYHELRQAWSDAIEDRQMEDAV